MALSREQFQQLRDQNLSVEQIIKFERGETPAQKQPQKKEGFFSGAIKAGAQFAETLGIRSGVEKGFAKEALRSATGLSSVGERALSLPKRLITGEKFESSAEKLIPKKVTATKGFQEKLGGLAENIAEFALPTGKITKAEKFLGITGKTAKSIAGRSAIEAGVGATQATLKEGGITDQAKKEGIFAGAVTAGLGLGGKAAGPIVKAIRPSSDSAIFRAIKPRLTKNRNLTQIKDRMATANTEIINRGFKPENVQEYADAVGKTKKSVWQDVEVKLGEGADKTVDYKKTVEAIDKEFNPKRVASLEINNPGVIDKIDDLKNRLLKQDVVDVLQAEDLKQVINAEVDSFFGKANLSKVEQNVKKIITRDIGEQLDSILSKIPNEFSTLKKTYGSLREIEDDVLKRLIVFERQNPISLLEGIGKVAGLGDIAKGMLTVPVAPVKGIAKIAGGVAEIAASKLAKQANDADTLIKNGFDEIFNRLKGVVDEAGNLRGRFFGGQESTPQLPELPKTLQKNVNP